MEYQPEPDKDAIDILRRAAGLLPVEEPGEDVVEIAARKAAGLPPKKQDKKEAADKSLSAARHAARLE
jgi:hypothetical protein